MLQCVLTNFVEYCILKLTEIA